MALWGSSANAAGFRCSASAGRIAVLGQVVEPLTANASSTACAGDKETLTGSAAGFAGPLTIGALLASTEVFPAQKIVVSTGGVADLTVSALPDLPITLPQVTVTDAAKALLRRRMILKSIDSENGRVTISGRVLPPLGEPLKAITLSRRVSCKKEQVVARFTPRPDGSFRVTVRAPKGVGAAVYRMTTRVRFSAAGSALFETYTLPRAVELHR